MSIRLHQLLLTLAWPLAAQPTVRAHHALIYDPVRHRVLLTGGSSPLEGGRSFAMYNDLWSFDGKSWTLIDSSAKRMSGMQLAWDPRTDRIVSFGGYDGSSLGMLRAFDGRRWQDLGTHPKLRASEPGFVYDSRRARFVLFGGSSGPGAALGETWEFDGTEWAKVDGPAPPPRQAHAMVYDTKRGRVVLFGGMGAASPGAHPPQLSDTWEFDGRRWIFRDSIGPGARFSPGVAYDSRRSRVILFGGLDSSGFKGDTWAWDGAKWTRLATTGPDARAMGYLAYDSRRDRVVLFGGRRGWPNGDLNDTWEFDGRTWRRVEPARRISRLPFSAGELTDQWSVTARIEGVVDVYSDSVVIDAATITLQASYPVPDTLTSQVDSIVVGLALGDGSWSMVRRSAPLRVATTLRRGERWTRRGFRATIPIDSTFDLAASWPVLEVSLRVPESSGNPYGLGWTYAHARRPFFPK